jgi:hypothetical protein
LVKGGECGQRVAGIEYYYADWPLTTRHSSLFGNFLVKKVMQTALMSDYPLPMYTKTDHSIRWTMTWINQEPANDNRQERNRKEQTTRPLVLMIIYESWTLTWEDEGESNELPTASESSMV